LLKPKVEIVTTGDSAYAMITGCNNESVKSAIIISVEYDATGSLLNVHIGEPVEFKWDSQFPIMTESISINKTSDTNTVKVFVWEEFRNIKPLSNVVVIK